MKTILCYGDSNTYGSHPDLIHRYDHNTRWPRLLQKLLGNEYYVIEEGLPGRTMVNFDPIEEYRSGKSYLIPCLQTHRPLDLIIIALGTNDLKPRFSLTAYEISRALENLILTVKTAQAGPDFGEPKILVIAPPPVGESHQSEDMTYMFENRHEVSRELPAFFRRIAEQQNVFMIDPTDIVEVSEYDGVHFTPAGHAAMANLVKDTVLKIFE